MTAPQKEPAGSERAIRDALAAGPTPGEWTIAKSYGSGARCSVKAGFARIAVPSVTNINWEANAALIAACNPEAIASLLAELDRLRASQPSGAAGEVDLDGRLPDRLEFSNRIPENVMAALNRMCSPLDPTRLTGFTAEQDAKCMALIRSYLLGEEVPAGSKDSHD